MLVEENLCITLRLSQTLMFGNFIAQLLQRSYRFGQVLERGVCNHHYYYDVRFHSLPFNLKFSFFRNIRLLVLMIYSIILIFFGEEYYLVQKTQSETLLQMVLSCREESI